MLPHNHLQICVDALRMSSFTSTSARSASWCVLNVLMLAVLLNPTTVPTIFKTSRDEETSAARLIMAVRPLGLGLSETLSDLGRGGGGQTAQGRTHCSFFLL